MSAPLAISSIALLAVAAAVRTSGGANRASGVRASREPAYRVKAQGRR